MRATVLEAEVNQCIAELAAGPSSTILVPWCRKSPGISEVLPLLYPHGPLPATVARLTRQWGPDHAAFQNRDLPDRDFVHVWADGVPRDCASPPGRGSVCRETAADAGCAAPSWWSVTAPWAFGGSSPRCSPLSGRKGAGFT